MDLSLCYDELGLRTTVLAQKPPDGYSRITDRKMLALSIGNALNRKALEYLSLLFYRI